MTVTPAVRIFGYSGVNLPDPNPRLSPEEVKAALANGLPLDVSHPALEEWFEQSAPKIWQYLWVRRRPA